MIDIKRLSTKYDARRLDKGDVQSVYELCAKNTVYYSYERMEPSPESVAEDMTALPPGKEAKDKYFVGFFDKDRLAAIMDVIDGYPERDTAYIGLFMVDKGMQGTGCGTSIISDTLTAFREAGFLKSSLGCIRENAEALAFWMKQGFVLTGEEKQMEHYAALKMDNTL